MANNEQKEKVGDDTPSGSEKHIDPNEKKENCNEETREKNPREKGVSQEGDIPKKGDRGWYYNEDDLQEWKDRCLRRDDEIKGMADKLADL